MDASVAWHVEQCTATDRTSASNSEPHTKQRLALCHVAAKVYKKICYATTVPDPKKFERGGRQFISHVVIYRKCIQQTLCLLHGKRRHFEKKN